MELLQLRYFVQTCDAGSFTKAAAGLSMTQPSLSRQIALLESEFEQRLLERTGRGVNPTCAGYLLLDHARSMLALAELTRTEMRDHQESPTGRVTIGLPPRLARNLTVKLVENFSSQFSRASLSIHEGLSANLRELLISGRLDVALLFDPPPSPGLVFETLKREALLFVSSRELDVPATLLLKDLAKYPLILPGAPSTLRLLIDSLTTTGGGLPKIVAEVGGTQSILPLVARNIGCSILPEGAINAYGIDDAIRASTIRDLETRSSLVLATTLNRPSNRLSNAIQRSLRTLLYSTV